MLEILQKIKIGGNAYEYLACYDKKINFSFRTYGRLNSGQSNSVLVNHPLSHSHNLLSSKPNESSWWDETVGVNKVIDLNKYFVIVVSFQMIADYFIKNSDSNLDFEFLSLLHGQVVNYFNIKKVFLVIGGSLGGMNALNFCCFNRFDIKGLIVISATHKSFPNQTLYRLLMLKLIALYKTHKDREFNKILRLLSVYTYRTPQAFNQVLPSEVEFIANYLDNSKNKLPEIDVDRYAYFLNLMNGFYLNESQLNKLPQNILLLGANTDNFYTPDQLSEFHQILIGLEKHAQIKIIETLKGHDAFLLEQEKFAVEIQKFIETLA